MEVGVGLGLLLLLLLLLRGQLAEDAISGCCKVVGTTGRRCSSCRLCSCRTDEDRSGCHEADLGSKPCSCSRTDHQGTILIIIGSGSENLVA